MIHLYFCINWLGLTIWNCVARQNQQFPIELLGTHKNGWCVFDWKCGSGNIIICRVCAILSFWHCFAVEMARSDACIHSTTRYPKLIDIKWSKVNTRIFIYCWPDTIRTNTNNISKRATATMNQLVTNLERKRKTNREKERVACIASLDNSYAKTQLFSHFWATSVMLTIGAVENLFAHKITQQENLKEKKKHLRYGRHTTHFIRKTLRLCISGSDVE